MPRSLLEKNTDSTAFLVMYVPTWFPGAGFQRWARDAKKTFYRLTREPFHRVKSEMVRIRLQKHCPFR